MAEVRKLELEKKRAKLEALRRAREGRKSTPAPAEVEKEKNKKDELDALLAELIPKPKEKEPVVESPIEEVIDKDKDTKPIPDSISIDTKVGVSDIPQNILNFSGLDTPTLSTRFVPDFVTFEAVILDIPPKEIVYYNKEVQTTATSFEEPPPSEEEIREKVRKEFEEGQKAKEAAAEEQRARQEAEKKKELKLLELSDAEKKNIVTSPEFSEFVTYSTKMVERALNENYDFMKDYTFSEETESDENGACVKHLCSFFDDRWSKSRFVTDVNWSQKNPELCVASYNKNPYNMNDPDGIVLIWNMRLLSRPEFVFHSQSDVLTTMFSQFHPSIVIGGTYSGQILLWDMRAKSLPVLKTPLSAAGHTHPVYSMQMVGTQNAHNLITSSTDGLVCSWQLETLIQPTETLELVHSEHNKTDEVSVTVFGFPENETSTFWVGTEEGNVYQANRFGHAGGKAGINQYDFYKGHWGPVTGLHFHPLVGPVDFSDLFLTSSVDWTVKLWKAKSISKPSAAVQTISPLYSFEGADDYIYDVKWSPTNPALFGSIDGKGNFAIWNLNDDTEVPIVNTQVSNGRALNKLQWDKEGKKAAIGSSDGRVHVYDVGELCHPREDEWVKMQKTLSEMSESEDLIGKSTNAK